MVKKIYKPICVILMLLIIVLTFSACAQIKATTITNDDNTVDEIVTIELDEIEVVNAGYSLALLKEDIKSMALTEAELISKEFNQSIEEYLQFNITEETKEVLNSYKNGITPIYSDWNNNIFKIGIRFKSVDVYKYYYNIQENQTIKYYVEEHFLYNKLYYYAHTKYVAYNDLYNRINTIYSMNYSNLIESESNELMYTYIAEQHREHSDANYINQIDGKYYHTWIIDKENIDKPIMIYYHVANAGNCILLCIAGTLLITLIIFLICLINIKYKKIKNSENINKNTQN